MFHTIASPTGHAAYKWQEGANQFGAADGKNVYSENLAPSNEFDHIYTYYDDDYNDTFTIDLNTVTPSTTTWTVLSVEEMRPLRESNTHVFDALINTFQSHVNVFSLAFYYSL